MTGQLATDTTLALGYCTASTYLFIEVSIMFICKCFNVIVGLPVYLYNLISLYFFKNNITFTSSWYILSC